MAGMKVQRVVLLLALSLTAAISIVEPRFAGADQPEVLQVEGLKAQVEILVDPWGVAHLYAQNEEDLFFAQGYSAARDRLFQFELWRRQATGTLSEILGSREVDRDIGARLLRFRGDLSQELNHYHPRGEHIIGAFVRGINAWIEQTRRDPTLLPLEFRLLQIEPGLWTPDVVVSRHQGLLYNLTQELDLGRAVALLGHEQVKELVWFHPGEPDVRLDPAIDGTLLHADILKHYQAARSPIRFLPEDVIPGSRATQTEPQSSDAAALLRSQIEGPDIGSNNWVVSGGLTESGATMLANDPHRALHVPSLRYFVHLVAPGWDVIGGGEPTLPGISIGHNDFAAWGLTIFRIDAEDLYVYQIHPDDPLKYRYGEGWESMRVVTESIPVKGEDPVTVELKFTRHGPVLHEDHEQRAAFALRAGWLEVGGAPYLASLRMNQATSWEEFREACRYSHIPGENMVWADRDGNIGWQAVGIAPRRPNWDGLVPVPGDGRYEWDGYLPINDLPHVLNPPQGFWNTSNENVAPPDYRHRSAIGWTWADPYRGARVHEVLSSGRKLNMAEMMRLQQDELSIPARSLVPLLRDLDRLLDPQETLVHEALRRLLAWDFVLDRQSIAAGIYIAWQRRLEKKMQELLVPQEARKHIGSLSMKRIIDWLLVPDGRFGDDPLAARDALLIDCLRQAAADLTERLGPELEEWQYGQSGYKHAWIRHPLSPAVNDELRAQLDVGPLPRGGDSYTVNNTGGSDNQPSGATFRVIIDTADWDRTLATSAPGQSGDPEASHYRDLFEMWATGRYFPLFYSRPKVESVSRQTLQLVPN
jgi:penicillin G amidase